MWWSRVKSGSTTVAFLCPMLEEIISLIIRSTSWSISVENVYSKANRCADIVARHAHAHHSPLIGLFSALCLRYLVFVSLRILWGVVPLV